VWPEQPSAASPESSGVAELQALHVSIDKARRELQALEASIDSASQALTLQEVGLYQYSHPLDTALGYKEQLDIIRGQARELAKLGQAVEGTKSWAVNGSQKEGARMLAELCKLLLRAYNSEADEAVRTVKPFTVENTVAKLQKARESIERLGLSMQIRISSEFHALRVSEIRLMADFLAKREEEKEREREARIRLKEEEAARRELEREQERLEKERSHYETLVATMRAKGDAVGLEKAEAKLTEVNAAIEGTESRLANTRAGYVYCISNIGAFGPGVVKIGMTRRLDPLDRVRELGDASVPFRFDAHTLIFSEDAVGLETMLHQRFASRRVNMVNAHREFFFVTPLEVREALLEVHGSVVTFEEVPEALEWRQSQHVRGGTTVNAAEVASASAASRVS
jgi:hypothetical protein